MRIFICLELKEKIQKEELRKIKRRKLWKAAFRYLIKFQPLIIAVFHYLIKANIE